MRTTKTTPNMRMTKATPNRFLSLLLLRPRRRKTFTGFSPGRVGREPDYMRPDYMRTTKTTTTGSMILSPD
jgi:hypothetical protein